MILIILAHFKGNYCLCLVNSSKFTHSPEKWGKSEIVENFGEIINNSYFCRRRQFLSKFDAKYCFSTKLEISSYASDFKGTRA